MASIPPKKAGDIYLDSFYSWAFNFRLSGRHQCLRGLPSHLRLSLGWICLQAHVVVRYTQLSAGCRTEGLNVSLVVG